MNVAVLDTAVAVLGFLSPFIADTILLVRVVAVYPPSKLPRIYSIAVYAPLALMKVARVINAVVCAFQLYQSLATATSPLSASAATWALPGPKIEWLLGTFDIT